MSRYKKVVMNEVELKEIGGQKAIIKPSVEDKFNALQLTSKAGNVAEIDKYLVGIRNHLTEVLFKSIFVFDANNRPTNKKIEGEENTTREDIDSYVVSNLSELWIEYLLKLDIIPEEKAKEIQDKLSESEKKK